MKGDFSRDTFSPAKHFSRVLIQQGRVQLDADFNEQVSILLHHMRALTADMFGPHAGPLRGAGFGVVTLGEPLGQELREKLRQKNPKASPQAQDFWISRGRYYVDGILIENDHEILYSLQDDLPNPADLGSKRLLIYLDVWERHISALEDDSIREVALGGPDTATRAKIVWQVKAIELNEGDDEFDFSTTWDELIERKQPAYRGSLMAQTPADQTSNDPCIIPPESRYRGAENQLYRVEIHSGSDDVNGPSFKWSRDNGTVVFPILTIGESEAATDGALSVRLAHLGQDSQSSLVEGDWAEIVDDSVALSDTSGPLVRVSAVDPVDMTVTLKPAKDATVTRGAASTGRLLRRWDQQSGDPRQGGRALGQDGAVPIGAKDDWISLEDGIQVQFRSTAPDGTAAEYRAGDYWLIPARTATGDVEWPREQDPTRPEQLVPLALPPRGIEHHFAPLAIVLFDSVEQTIVHDLRCLFEQLPCTVTYGYSSTYSGHVIGPDF